MPEASVKPDLGALRIDAHKRGSRNAGKRIAIILFVLLAALVIAGGVYAYMHQAPSVQVATADAPDNGPQALLNASGYVTPQRRATVAAKITGRVTGVFFTEGMHVHKGFVLATLDDSDAQRALASAKADRNATQASILDLQVQLKNAQIELHRAQELRTAGIQTQEALDNATMAVNSLKAKIDYTQATGARGLTRASKRRSRRWITASSPLRSTESSFPRTRRWEKWCRRFRPAAASRAQASRRLSIWPRMKSKWTSTRTTSRASSSGQEVTAVLDAYPDWKIPCHVRTIIPTADRQKATVEVRIAFDKLDPRILPDMGVKVTFLGEEAKQEKEAPAGVMVPQNAVRDDGGQKIVFLVRGDHVERHAVKVGTTNGAQTQILAGLASGDTVVVGGPADLKDGETVAIKR